MQPTFNELFTGGSIFQQNAGHMVVTSEAHELLLDPTFQQFTPLGEEAVALFVDEAKLRANRFWQAGDDKFYARYYSADEFMELDFDLVRAASESKADEVVTYLSNNPR